MAISRQLGLLVLTALLALGQATEPAPLLSDQKLEQDVQARFSRSKIAANGFVVRVHDGEVVIEGKTDVIQHKGTATRLARLAGARSVDNRIKITEEARQKAARKRRGKPRRVHVQRSQNR